MSTKFKNLRYVSVLAIGAIFFSLFVYSALKSEAASSEFDNAEKEMEELKVEMEKPNSSRGLVKKYSHLADILSDCGPLKQIIKETGIDDPFAPTSNLCINGSLAVGDATYNRPTANSSGSGFGGSCTPSGSATAVFYDVYSFNLTGCAAFPTVVTTSLCGPAGCTAAASFDSVMILYRNVSAGDPLTANGGLPSVFNPAAPCTNARALNDDTGATPTSPGGSTCNQSNTSDCTASCSPTTSLSQMKRNLGDGRFTVVVTAFSNGATANYNLYIDAPAAGCVVALSPTAAEGRIGGRVSRANGNGISKAAVTLTGGGLTVPVRVLTNAFGYYNFEELEVGHTYTLTVESKTHTFTNSTQVITLQDNVGEVNFVSEQ